MNSTRQVVHVDDDPDILAIARMSLEVIGAFDVRQYASARELLAELSTLKPDLFLLDVMMPEMDGLKLLSEIRKNPDFKTTPAVFLTAKADFGINENSLGHGKVDYIGKPFDPITLSEKLHAMMA